jgi:hypothetical protein
MQNTNIELTQLPVEIVVGPISDECSLESRVALSLTCKSFYEQSTPLILLSEDYIQKQSPAIVDVLLIKCAHEKKPDLFVKFFMNNNLVDRTDGLFILDDTTQEFETAFNRRDYNFNSSDIDLMMKMYRGEIDSNNTGRKILLKTGSSTTSVVETEMVRAFYAAYDQFLYPEEEENIDMSLITLDTIAKIWALRKNQDEEYYDLELDLLEATHLEIVDFVKDLLTNKDVRYNTENENGETALHFACYKMNKALVSMLLNKKDINPNVINIEGNTPLHIAMSDQSLTAGYCDYDDYHDICCLLLQKKGIDVTIKNFNDETPLDIEKRVRNNVATYCPNDKEKRKALETLFPQFS